MLIDGGEIAVFVSAGILGLISLICLAFGLMTKNAGAVMVCIVFLLIGGIVAGCGFLAGHNHYATRTAWSDLEKQGVAPLDVNLFEAEATVKTRDGCVVTRAVVYTEKDGYQLALDGKVLKLSELSCVR